ncbi:MAG: hypothetical protein H6Q90_8 [Deltaproteobacteria bacterium]|nr:hypothetical protein [Deltaproteobacteria bacterium]
MFRALLSSALVFSFLPSCADTGPTDELAGESNDGEAGKDDSADAFTFFAVTPDVRACSFDARCGGFFVSRPNRSTTICGRGSTADRCYVDSLDFSGTAMPDSVAMSYQDRIRAGETFLLRGDISPAPDDRGASLHITEVWVSGSSAGVTDGVFVLVKDNGVRCITAPCPNVSEQRLNSTRHATIHEIDLSTSGADDATIGRATSDLFDAGIIIVGDRYYPARAKGRSANQFFTKAPVPLF